MSNIIKFPLNQYHNNELEEIFAEKCEEYNSIMQELTELEALASKRLLKYHELATELFLLANRMENPEAPLLLQLELNYVYE